MKNTFWVLLQQGGRLAIWRQILVPGSIRLSNLHGVLLWTMGWEGGHLHEFVFGHQLV